MLVRYCAFCLALLVPLQAAAQEAYKLNPRDQLDRPYVALFESSSRQYSSGDLKSLSANIEQERKQEAASCEENEKRLREQLNSARRDLNKLNETAPRDTMAMAAARSKLHSEIAALEQVVRDKKRECEHLIPAEYEIKLAKARLLTRWPQRSEQTDKRIEDGLARSRKHGNVEDIGYRGTPDDQEKDIPTGEQAFRQMASSKLMPSEVQNPIVRQYVHDLAGKIAANSDLKVPLHLTVLDSSEINSIGLPGGFLFVTSGLVLACETESELAGVISQQIAHIAARHGTRASKRSVIAKMFVPVTQVATGLFTGGVGNAGVYYGMNYGFQGLGLLVDRALIGSNANAQKEADQLGIQYAWKAGFDPKGFIAFLDVLAKNKDYSKTDTFFLTKPPLDERVLDAFTEVQYLPRKENYTVDSVEFQRAKTRLQNSISRW